MKKIILLLFFLLIGCKERKHPKIVHVHVYCLQDRQVLRCSDLFPDNSHLGEPKAILGYVDAVIVPVYNPNVEAEECTVKSANVVYLNAHCVLRGDLVPVHGVSIDD